MREDTAVGGVIGFCMQLIAFKQRDDGQRHWLRSCNATITVYITVLQFWELVGQWQWP